MASKVRIKLVGMLVALLAMAAPASASAAPGDLDPTFGGDGKVTTDFGGSDPARAVAVQANGKIIVAGGNGDFALARYNQDGSLDTGFGGDGMVTTDFGGSDSANSVVVQPNGKVIAAGTSSSSFALARYNQDGTPDTSFGGGDGLVTTAFPGSSEGDAATGLVLQPDGKLVAAGTSSSSFALARYDSGGSLDPGFGGGDGLVTTAFPDSEGDEGNELLLQPNGMLIVVGTTHIPPYGRGSFALARYNADGTPDTGFGGGDGLATGIDNNQATSAALAPNGQIAVAGGWEYFRVARFNSDGSVDTGFDGTGALFPDYRGTGRLAYAVQVQKDGRVVAAGFVEDEITSETDFAVARFDTDGSLDASFGADGMVTTDFSGGRDYARAIALQPDGDIVVAGRTESPESDFAVARYEGHGPPPPPTGGPAAPASGGGPNNPVQAQPQHKAHPRGNGTLRKCRTLKSKPAKRKCARRHAPRSSVS